MRRKAGPYDDMPVFKQIGLPNFTRTLRTRSWALPLIPELKAPVTTGTKLPRVAGRKKLDEYE